MSEKNKKILSSCLFLIIALLWGIAFVAQDVSMNYIGPFTVMFLRFFIASIVVLPFAVLSYKGDRKKNQRSGSEKKAPNWKIILKSGTLCGIAIFTASTLQQFGLQNTSVGKSGFITALYIIFVPFLGVFIKKRIGIKAWICAVVALMGLYLVCITDEFSFSIGDILTLGCALMFAVQIMLLDHYTGIVNVAMLSLIQFVVSAILGLAGTLIFEKIDLGAIMSAIVPILYIGVISSGVCYTLQAIGQKYADPTVASLFMSTESVFAALAGWVILNEALTVKEVIGCAIIFAAVIFSQLPVLQPRRTVN